MRNHNIPTAVMAVVMTLAGASTALASDEPLECRTSGGNWDVVASAPFSATCAGNADCTGMEYEIIPVRGLQPDHVAILVDHDVSVIVPGSQAVASPCAGDTVTLLGSRDCSRRAVRMNRDADTGFFEVIGSGTLGPIGSSIVVKKGSRIEHCRIASLGGLPDKFDPNAQVTTSQSLTFKGCTLTVPTDPETGEGGVATISGPGCKILANGKPVQTSELFVDGVSVGNLSYGEGHVSTGSNSCTTKLISRKLYTMCTCADAADPNPPCD